MGFRFRKSVSFGKGFRVNFSKSGVGWSVGGKGFRYTKKAGGGSRTTSSIPGTGISYSKDYGKNKSTRQSQSPQNSQPSPEITLLSILIVVFFGLLFLNSYVALAFLVIALSGYIYIKVKANAKIKLSAEDQLKLQKILVADSPDYLVMSKKQLLEQARFRLSNNMRIIKESAAIVESTCDVGTFFSRFDLIIERYKDCCLFEPLIPFEGHSPTGAYNQAVSERQKEIEKFVHRHIAKLIEDAAKLKTERGRQNRYAKSYEAFKNYYSSINESNQAIIESEFDKIIINREEGEQLT